jgi:shikimate kinase
MNIVLIGYRGSGKSAIGKLLAARLGMTFADTDEWVVRQAGKSIQAIFADVGEAGFRDLESAAVQALATPGDNVIATGGGVVLRPDNVSRLKENGRVVWLNAPAEVLWQRIAADPGSTHARPNLTASGGLEEIRRLLEVRNPLYAAAADITLDVSVLSASQAAYYLSEMV